MFETNNNNKKSHNFEDFKLIMDSSINMSDLKVGLDVFGFGYELHEDMALVYLDDSNVKTIFVRDAYNFIKDPVIYYATFGFDSSFSRRYVMIVSSKNVPTYEILAELRDEFPRLSEVYNSNKWEDINKEHRYRILCTVIFNKCFY